MQVPLQAEIMNHYTCSTRASKAGRKQVTSPLSHRGSENTYEVNRHQSCDQYRQHDAHYAGVAHPPIPGSTKVAGLRNIVPAGGEQGDSSCDDESGD